MNIELKLSENLTEHSFEELLESFQRLLNKNIWKVRKFSKHSYQNFSKPIRNPFVKLSKSQSWGFSDFKANTLDRNFSRKIFLLQGTTTDPKPFWIQVYIKVQSSLKKSFSKICNWGLTTPLLLKCFSTGMLQALACIPFIVFWLILTGFVSLWLKGSWLKKLKDFVWFPYGSLRLNAVKLLMWEKNL